MEFNAEDKDQMFATRVTDFLGAKLVATNEHGHRITGAIVGVEKWHGQAKRFIGRTSARQLIIEAQDGATIRKLILHIRAR